MPVHMNIDRKLLKEARQLGKHRTYKEALHAALRAYIERRVPPKEYESLDAEEAHTELKPSTSVQSLEAKAQDDPHKKKAVCRRPKQ